MAGIPVPAPLKLGVNDEEAFKVFKLQWNYYSLAAGVATKPANQQVATLMAIMGAEGVVLLEELNLTAEERGATATIMQKIEEHLVPQRDKRVERAEFNLLRQREGEKIEEFVRRLRKKAAGCGFAADQLEELIKERLVAGMLDNQVRRELLKAGDIPVSDMVKMVKEHQQIEELARKYESMSVKEEPSLCTADALKINVAKKMDKECIYCGSRHPRDKNKCPAWGKKCAN